MKHNKNFYLLVLLSTVSILSIIVGLLSKWVFSYPFWMGLSLLMVCFILYYQKRNKFKSFFGIILILSILRIIQFVPFRLTVGLGVLPFEVIPTIFFLLFVFLNRSRVLDIIQDWFTTSDEEKEKNSISKQESFKKDFQILSDIEIEYRLKESLVPEARKALIEIKEERDS
jgi:signal transduction histidine kinase